MSDTPRTDAAVSSGGVQINNVADCSRQLERELADTKLQLEAAQVTADECAVMIAQKNAELAELREDKERLDWLENERRSVDFFIMDDPSGNPTRRYVQIGGVGIEKARPTLRESIAAAMDSK